VGVRYHLCLMPGCAASTIGADESMAGVRELSKNYQKGLEFYDQGLLVDALSAFEAVLSEAGPETPEYRLARFFVGETHSRLAEENAHRGSRERAEFHLRKAIERNPRFPDLHYQLAMLIAQEEALHEAMAELEAALEINPNFAKALFVLGVLAYEIGEYDAGVKHMMRAAELEPRYATQAYHDAMAAHQAKEHRKALSQFRELALTNLDDISFHFGVGKKLYRSGDYDGAAEAFEQALSLQCNYPDIRNWLGLSLMACGNHAGALEQFQRALEVNPNYVAALINAGVACAMAGRTEDASGYYRRALDLDPDNPEARERLAKLGVVA